MTTLERLELQKSKLAYLRKKAENAIGKKRKRIIREIIGKGKTVNLLEKLAKWGVK